MPVLAEDILPLISEWGTAVENGENSDAELASLLIAHETWPADVTEAINFASEWQFAQIEHPVIPVPKDSPAHPTHRHARVEMLKTLLGLPTASLV